MECCAFLGVEGAHEGLEAVGEAGKEYYSQLWAARTGDGGFWMGLRDGGFAGLTFVRGCVCEDSGGTWILEIRGILWGDMRLMRANFSWVFDFVIIFWVIVSWGLRNVVLLHCERWINLQRPRLIPAKRLAWLFYLNDIFTLYAIAIVR